VLGSKILALTAALAAAPVSDDPFLPNIPPGSGDLIVRPLLTGTVTAAFFRSDFATLEAMAKSYRESEARTPSGTWKLDLFYVALDVEPDAAHPGDDYRLKQAEKKDLAWIAADPQSPTPYIVYAEQLLSHAWSIRGGGYADKVSPDAWPKFRAYLQQARDVLEKHKSVAGKDPQWYSSMLDVALGQGWDKAEFEPLLNEGLDRFPYYYPIYFGGATHYLPVWGGNADDLESFVDDAVARTAPKEGTMIYGRLYANVAHSFQNVFVETRVQWPKMLNAFLELSRRYPDARNDSRSAYFACAAGDKIWTARMFQTLQNPPQFDIWRTQENLDLCRTWATDSKTRSGTSPLPGYRSLQSMPGRDAPAPHKDKAKTNDRAI